MSILVNITEWLLATGFIYILRFLNSAQLRVAKMSTAHIAENSMLVKCQMFYVVLEFLKVYHCYEPCPAYSRECDKEIQPGCYSYRPNHGLLSFESDKCCRTQRQVVRWNRAGETLHRGGDARAAQRRHHHHHLGHQE